VNYIPLIFLFFFLHSGNEDIGGNVLVLMALL